MFIQLSSQNQTNIRRVDKNTSINQHKKTQKIMSYYDYGQIQDISWLKNGNYHRFGGAAAYIAYFRNGQIRHKSWYRDGHFHRGSAKATEGDAPAIIEYYETGQIESESWFKDGKYHRNKGPDIVFYFENGTLKKEIMCNTDELEMEINS